MPEATRLRIGERARVLAAHTSVHHAMELERYVHRTRDDRARSAAARP